MNWTEENQIELNLLISDVTSKAFNGNISCNHCSFDFCCHNQKHIHINEYEAKVIAKYSVKQHKIKAQISQKDLKEKDVYSCPYLKNGKCSIYEIRPSTCAMYSVLSSSFLCGVPDAKVLMLNPFDFAVAINNETNIPFSFFEEKKIDIFEVALNPKKYLK